jgi:hypothetical protein
MMLNVARLGVKSKEEKEKERKKKESQSPSYHRSYSDTHLL